MAGLWNMITDTVIRSFKLMPDYECWPLWETTDGEFCNLDPETLGLSEELLEQIELWADRYDASLKPDDPEHSGFQTDEQRLGFERDGLLIWWALQLELPDAEISYFSELFQRLYKPV